MNKIEQYEQLYRQAESLIDPSVDRIANMANLSVLIQETFQFHWVGFYRVQGQQLVLGPFSGPVACTRIGYDKGVCGSSWARQETLIVDDVNAFPGHIACSPHSKSEIVVPCLDDREVWAVLDIDSAEFSSFDQTDKSYLERIVALL